MTKNPHSCWWILSALSVEPPTNLFFCGLSPPPPPPVVWRQCALRNDKWVGRAFLREEGKGIMPLRRIIVPEEDETRQRLWKEKKMFLFSFLSVLKLFYRDFPDEVMQNVSMTSAWIGHVLFWPNICPSLCGRDGDKELPRNCSMT